VTHQEQNTQSHTVTYGHYFLIWMGLIALTCATVSLAGIDFGRWVVVITLSIAGIKSMLVLNIFMHLKFEERIFKIFVLIALTTFFIFIGLTFADYAFY
jgi:cytochrome c oxidase subunit 4